MRFTPKFPVDTFGLNRVTVEANGGQVLLRQLPRICM